MISACKEVEILIYCACILCQHIFCMCATLLFTEINQTAVNLSYQDIDNDMWVYDILTDWGKF